MFSALIRDRKSTLGPIDDCWANLIDRASIAFGAEIFFKAGISGSSIPSTANALGSSIDVKLTDDKPDESLRVMFP